MSDLPKTLSPGLFMFAFAIMSALAGFGISWGVMTTTIDNIQQTQARHDREITLMQEQMNTTNVQLAEQKQLLLDIKNKLTAL